MDKKRKTINRNNETVKILKLVTREYGDHVFNDPSEIEKQLNNTYESICNISHIEIRGQLLESWRQSVRSYLASDFFG